MSVTGSPREAQLAYSEIQSKMLDERHRRQKAAKIIAVLRHVLGEERLPGLRVADLGCSAGFISDELAKAGCAVTGFDIDVPGIQRARERFGSRVNFVCADGEDLPLEDGSMDVVVFNHIYEHVVDPDRVLDEIYRVLNDGGIAYLGLGNKYGILEPHYRLPFLSWLPQSVADSYVSLFGRADAYYESYRSRGGLRNMVAGFYVLDYTIPVLRNPSAFAGSDAVPGWVGSLPEGLLEAAMPLVPTYIWVAAKRPLIPADRDPISQPRFVPTARTRTPQAIGAG